MRHLFEIRRKRFACDAFLMSGLAIGIHVMRNAMFPVWEVNVWLGPFVVMCSWRVKGEADD